MMRKSAWILAIFSFSAIFPHIIAPARVFSVEASIVNTRGVLALKSDFGAVNAILATADQLSSEYGSRPPYSGPYFAPGEPLSPEEAIHTLPYVIACESRDRSVKIVDSNGYYSYGIAQIQSSTWADFVKESGMGGDPMIKADAVRMGLWAFEHGYLYKWSCATILGVIHTP
jgi:hypothetical protein